MKTKTSAWIVAGALCLGGIGYSSSAFAQGNAAAAEALFNEARKAMDAKDYDTACQRFKESNRLDPAPGTIMNLAACEEARGNLATAWELFVASYQKLPDGDRRRSYAQERAASLEPRLPKITFKLKEGSPPETTVREGEANYGSGSFGIGLPVNPGKHEFVVEAPNHAPKTFEVEIAEAAKQVLEVEPGEEQAATTSLDPPSEHGAGSGSQQSGMMDAGVSTEGTDNRTLGYILAGVGGAGVITGIVTGVMALGKKSTADEHCSGDLQVCDQTGRDAVESGQTLAIVSTASWIVGALGLGAGAYFIFTSGGDESADAGPATQTKLATGITPGGFQLGVTQTF